MSVQVRKYYWIDRSCNELGNGDVEAYITEARHWARRAYDRLRSRRDTDFARVFNVIFKTPKSDQVPYPKPSLWRLLNGTQPKAEWVATIHHVLHLLHDFSHNWSRTPHREMADVRLYFNAGAKRWVSIADGRLYDPVNHVYNSSNWDDLTDSEAVTSFVLPCTPAPGRHENPQRVTIDLLPPDYSTPGDRFSLAQIDPDAIATLGIHGLTRAVLPRVLLHQFMRTRAYLLDDFPGDDETAGWEYCMRRRKGEAAGCAESIAMLGLWAGLADMRPAGKKRGGFTMDRAWDLIPGGWDDEHVLRDDEGEGVIRDGGTGKWDVRLRGNGPVHGEVRFYEDMTGNSPY
ncbi:hypothetical protein BT67DRAFT_484675 [Trichocladium antarcticum]|uniref:Uncharacterized protein n=1 Tax=Trichocladium antarcticum TaxID=1450529 RepID=A0AAN6UFU7_9PEZI|nr:hypothetical protein BT67DRAFT_484675 [Trichocladium antarcticum]